MRTGGQSSSCVYQGVERGLSPCHQVSLLDHVVGWKVLLLGIIVCLKVSWNWLGRVVIEAVDDLYVSLCTLNSFCGVSSLPMNEPIKPTLSSSVFILLSFS